MRRILPVFAGLVAIGVVAWFGGVTQYATCVATLRADNRHLEAIDAAMASRLERLAALLRQGPLDPSAHEIDRILTAGDPTEAAFGILGPWLDPGAPVPFWSGENTPIPEGLRPEALYRLRFTEFSHIWLQVQIIAVHLPMHNDADIGLVENHRIVLLKELEWLDAVNRRSPRPTLSAMHCVRR